MAAYKSVLVIGGAGFVMSNLAQRLNELDHSVTIVDDFSFGFESNIPDDVTFIKSRYQSLDESFIKSFDVIVFGMCSNIIFAMEHPIETFINNSLDAMEFIDRCGDKKIIYSSTSSVYGGAFDYPTKEDEIQKCYNAYDSSKYILELYLKKRGNYTTLRLSNVYGERQRPENPYCGVMGKFLDCALNGESMEIYGDGKSTRDYTYVGDTVDAFVMAVEQDAKNTEINVGTGIETSVIDLAQMISGILNVPTSIKYVNKRSIDRISRRQLDISRAEKLLGWKPMRGLVHGIKMTSIWMKQQQKKNEKHSR